MTWIRRLVGSRRPAGPGANEIAALELILTGDDPRLRLVREQLVRAPEIERENPAPDTFRVRPTSTYDDLTFPLEIDRLTSEPLRVTDATTGRELEFRVVLGRHGFLRGLEGRMVDGGLWPSEWSIGSVEHPPGPMIDLPPAGEAAAFEASARQRLAHWIGGEIGRGIDFTPPASDAAVALREREVGGTFSEGYRTLLGITDGLAVRGTAIHGHRDAYPIDNPHLPALLVAWDADDRDEYVAVISLAGDDERVYRIDVHDAAETPQPIATTFAEFVGEFVRVQRR